MGERPESVQIGPYRYMITADAAALKDYEHGQNSRVWGAIRFREGDILLDPTMNIEKERVTLLHEVIHGCNFIAGTFGAKHEERIVQALAHSLLDTLRRNPDLLTYLTSEVN